jgi:glutaredoxin
MRLVLAIVLLGIAAMASAQLYRWTDEKGKVHFGDTPPPAGARNVQKKAVAPASSSRGASEPYILQQPMKDFPVTLYSAPSCESCGPARQLLNARGVPFKEISVTTNDQIAELSKAVGGNVVPALIVGPSVIKGYEEGAYHRALDVAGYPKPGVLPARAQAAPKAAAKPEEKKPAAEPAPAKRGRYYSPER